MRRLLPALAIIFVTAAYGQEPARPAGEMGRYTNKQWRWSIAYPAGWKVESKDPDQVRLRSSGEDALCTIYSGAMDRFKSVDELTEFLLANDAQFFKEKKQTFTVLARRTIKLPNGIGGNDILAEIGPGGRSRRVHVLAGGRGFALDCEGYTKNWGKLEPSYQRVIASFTVSR